MAWLDQGKTESAASVMSTVYVAVGTVVVGWCGHHVSNTYVVCDVWAYLLVPTSVSPTFACSWQAVSLLVQLLQCLNSLQTNLLVGVGER
jgi:hypothetical protein